MQFELQQHLWNFLIQSKLADSYNLDQYKWMYTHKIVPYERKSAVKANVSSVCVNLIFFSLFGALHIICSGRAKITRVFFFHQQVDRMYIFTQSIPTCGMYRDAIEWHIYEVVLNSVNNNFHSMYTQFFVSSLSANTRYDFCLRDLIATLAAFCLCVPVFVSCAFAKHLYLYEYISTISVPMRLMVKGNYVSSLSLSI